MNAFSKSESHNYRNYDAVYDAFHMFCHQVHKTSFLVHRSIACILNKADKHEIEKMTETT